MVDATEGHEGSVRIKLENTSNNWSNTSGGYPPDPYLTSSPMDTDVSMEKIYVIGNRNAIDTVEGVIDITGSIERPLLEARTNNEIIWNATGDNASYYTLAEVCGLYGTNVSKCTMLIKPNDNQTYVYHNVKFHSYSLGLAQGEITTESADFTADNISTS